MPCTNPIRGYRGTDGKIRTQVRGSYSDRHIEIPCRQCRACRIDRAAQWTTRIVHEVQTTRESCAACKDRNQTHTCGSSFVTLTYSNDHLPLDAGLDTKHLQDFIRSLRKRLGPVRYYACGEYGDRNKRPHYHAILFGMDFMEDRIPIGPNERGDLKYMSPILNHVWGKGDCQVGAATRESANYVARYVMKRRVGTNHDSIKPYLRTDGKITWAVNPEFAIMSLKPGIGAAWVDKYRNDVYPNDNIRLEGKRVTTPKYYDKRASRFPDELVIETRMARTQRAKEKRVNNTPERLEMLDRYHQATEKTRQL